MTTINCEAHIEKTNELRKTIYGNGKPGLAYDMIQVKITNKIILALQLLMFGALAKIIVVGV